MKNKLIFVLITFISFSSCNKDRLGGNKEALVGTWNWQRTDMSHYCNGGIEYETYESDTANETYRIEFLKEGIIQFYKNDILESEHFIKFNAIGVQEDGIVPSHRQIVFEIFLDGDGSNRISGTGTQKEMKISNYPFELEEDCHHWLKNYFRKEY